MEMKNKSVTFNGKTMSKLQNLNVYLTDTLTLVAQDILKTVENLLLEFNEEICRSRQEIYLLKRGLTSGDKVNSETQTESQEQNCSQIFSKEWKDTAMQMKLEVYTHHEENEAPVCSTSASSSQCLDDFQDQISSKDTAAQFKHNHQNSFVNQEIQIKIEPETMEANVSFQLDGNDLGDGLKEPVEDPLSNRIIISNIGSLTHQTKPFKPPFINQEMSKQHAMHPSQTGKSPTTSSNTIASLARPAGVEQNKARPHRPQHFPNVHEKPVFYEENITKETKRMFAKTNCRESQSKSVSAAYCRNWRKRIKNDPLKYAQYRASENARCREYRRKKAEAAGGAYAALCTQLHAKCLFEKTKTA